MPFLDIIIMMCFAFVLAPYQFSLDYNHYVHMLLQCVCVGSWKQRAVEILNVVLACSTSKYIHLTTATVNVYTSDVKSRLVIYFHHKLFLICREEYMVMTHHDVFHLRNIRYIVTCCVKHTKNWYHYTDILFTFHSDLLTSFSFYWNGVKNIFSHKINIYIVIISTFLYTNSLLMPILCVRQFLLKSRALTELKQNSYMLFWEYYNNPVSCIFSTALNIDDYEFVL